MDIQERYPELYSFIDEMTITIPNQKNPEIGIDNLEAYFDSLSFLQQGYLIHKTDKRKDNSNLQIVTSAHLREDGYPLYAIGNGHFPLINEENEF